MKRLSLFISAIMFAVSSFAQLSIWDGTDDVWTKGAGTESSPYLIESAQQLAFIASMVNGGVTTYENTYFKLMTNIDLKNHTWVPIGESETKCFKGHFDGNNKTIQKSRTTMFGYIKSASVSRLNVKMKSLIESAEQSTISYCTNIVTASTNGGICSVATSCQITNCYCVLQNIKFKAPAGGIVGYATSSAVKFCRVDGKAYIDDDCSNERTNYKNCGGIVGVLNSGWIYCCANKCSVLGGYGNINFPYFSSGGILGLGLQSSIQSCYNLDSVAYYANGYSNNGIRIQLAGICGLPGGKTSVYIKNCFTTMRQLYSPEHLKNAGYPNNLGSFSIYNSYTRTDKTLGAMKSASFPIILNTDSTIFIKDITPNVNNGYPIHADQVYVATDALSTIGFTSAQLLGHFYALNADSIGFEYKEATDNTHWYKSVLGQATEYIATCNLSNLIPGTNYVYRLWVERNGVRYFGDVLSFTTQQCGQIITPLKASICQGEEYVYRGKTLTRSCVCEDTLIASNGCDSIVKFTLTVMPTTNINKYDTILVGENYDFYGNILTETGDYEHYIPMVNKCNLVILHLYVRQPSVVVTATSSDATMGSVTGGGTYEKYSQVTLTAIPYTNYEFVTWNNGVNSNPYIFTVTNDVTIRAIFRSKSEGINDVDDAGTTPNKIFLDGQIFILRGDKTYTIDGRLVR